MTGVPRLVIELDSGVPPWRQVRDQLVLLIAGGRLPIGAQLPTIRQLAGDLGLAPGTVARAYRELESAGLLHTARRRGTMVIAVPTDPLHVLATDYVHRVRALGAEREAALAAVRQAFDSIGMEQLMINSADDGETGCNGPGL